jgi:hypothetical protein
VETEQKNLKWLAQVDYFVDIAMHYLLNVPMVVKTTHLIGYLEEIQKKYNKFCNKFKYLFVLLHISSLTWFNNRQNSDKNA